MRVQLIVRWRGSGDRGVADLEPSGGQRSARAATRNRSGLGGQIREVPGGDDSLTAAGGAA